jgi:TnpA family transposase
MAVDFLTTEQKLEYGQFSGEPNELELSQYFHLNETDLNHILQRRGENNRFGFALQLTSVRFLGTFMTDPRRVPTRVKNFIAQQLSIKSIDVLADYGEREMTKWEHLWLIRKHYGYHEFNTPPWKFRLTRALYSRAWISDERPGLMFDFATAWLIQRKVLLPGVTTLTRLISEIRERIETRLWEKLSSMPSPDQIVKLEALLRIMDGKRFSLFDHYRKGPVTISGPAFNKAVDRFLGLRFLEISKLDFSQIPPVRLERLARYAGISSVYKIARMPFNKRIAVLVAYVKTFETIALDEALDVLDMLIANIVGNAKRIGQKNRLRTLKDLDKSALLLAKACSYIIDEETEDKCLRDIVYGKYSREELMGSISMVNALARNTGDNFQKEMVEQYGRVCRFLPKLFSNIPFCSTSAGRPVLEAFNYLANIPKSRNPTLRNPPVEIVTGSWKKLVFNQNGAVDKKAYTLCFIDKLRDAFRRRDVYVKASDRWGDPRAKLIQGTEWEVNRIHVCRSIGHPSNACDAIVKLVQQLDAKYRKVAENFVENKNINIDYSGKYPSLTISPLDKLEEPPSLLRLNNQINELIPSVDLTGLLLEINAHTKFADEFTHVSESNARAKELATSICAVLVAEACNIGIEPLAKHHVPALTRHRLNWVKQNYFREETLIKANAKLVDFQTNLTLAKKWGGGDVASADGMRFVAPIRTINAGANSKYFGRNRGITWYNFISDQFSGFHGIVVPGTIRDSIFVLEGLLEQQTGLSPMEIITDTAGSSDIIFGLFWLLGYQFSPRIADAGEATFWRVNKNADYGALNELARNKLSTKRIEQYWDDMLRIAGSLKMGKIHASALIRSLLKSDRPSSLAKAIMDAGRINKTLYLLNYIDDQNYRRRILNQLNRGESRHSVARAICYGQRGEIRKRYREGQEDQLGALGLVTNAVVLWNTIYIQEAVNHLKMKSIDVKSEDETRLSPLINKHINMLGHYSFTLEEDIKRGKLRPLNQNLLNAHIP